jgi:hypothetical protein
MWGETGRPPQASFSHERATKPLSLNRLYNVTSYQSNCTDITQSHDLLSE